MPDSELSELRRAMEVGFTRIHGRFDVVEERIAGIKATQKDHAKELKETRSRRWPLPVVSAIGGLGGIASVVAWAQPHR